MTQNFVFKSKVTLEKIGRFLHRTPLIRSEYFSDKFNKNVFFKLENIQKTNSFKVRGALAKGFQVLSQNNHNGVSSSSGNAKLESQTCIHDHKDSNQKIGEQEHSKHIVNGFVTASGGNHGLGVSFVGRIFKIPVHVFVFETVSQYKRNALQKLGANVQVFGSVFDECNERALQFAREHNMTYIHPFDDDEIIAGQSTIAYEIFEDFPSVYQKEIKILHENKSNIVKGSQNDKNPSTIDAIICSIGGGGLISGVSQIAKSMNHDCKIFGVETLGAPKMYQSLKQGKVVKLDKLETIAEGLSARSVSERTFKIAQEFVDQCFLVSDQEAMHALRETLQHEKQLLEPAASASVAALDQVIAAHPHLNNIVVILCGGNFMIEKISPPSPPSLHP